MLYNAGCVDVCDGMKTLCVIKCFHAADLEFDLNRNY